MDLIKGYETDEELQNMPTLDGTQSNQDTQDDRMVDENRQSEPTVNECDQLTANDLVKDLVERLTASIDQTESDGKDQAKDNPTKDNQAKVQRKPKIRRKNEDEIAISTDESSSDESSCDESSSDESSLGARSVGEPDSEPEENDLDKCLTRLAPMKTRGEVLIEELPPPEEENIQLTCNVDRLQQIGSVTKILENLVIVESFKDLPALDLDSVLFFRTGKSIGRVFDVIGSVSKPFYIIRFVSHQKIQENSIFVQMPVYFVPPNLCLASFQELNVTKYVLVSQLKSTKGTDASWLHNNEPPENVKEYSDDEEERRDQAKMKAKRKRDVGHAGPGRQNSLTGSKSVKI